MGFRNHIKKILGSNKNKKEKINDIIVEEMKRDDNEFNEGAIDKQREDVTVVDVKINPTHSLNFKYFDNLIHSGQKEIVLNSDIVLSEEEVSEYLEGISLDVDDLVIDGNDHTIDARGKARIFKCISKNILIKNISFKNGFNKEYGGAIENSGELNILNSIFTENLANYSAGAIFNNEGKLTLKKSQLINNSVKYQVGGAICTTGELIVENSKFEKNTSFGNGGAIANVGGKAIISQSKFNENTWSSISNDGRLTVKDSTFNENTSNIGGAIVNYDKLIIEGSIFVQNNAKEWGGAIYNTGNLNIIKTSFDKNNAKEVGGAIYNKGGEVSISKSELCKNNSNKDGGAICNYEGTSMIFDCEISKNNAQNDIILNNDALQVYNSNFRDNRSKYLVLNNQEMSNITVFHGKFIENDIEEAVIFNKGNACTIEKTIFGNNSSNDIINQNYLTLIDPKMDDDKTILNEERIFIRNSSTDLKSKIYGPGIVEVYEELIPYEEKFDFEHFDKKIHLNEEYEDDYLSVTFEGKNKIIKLKSDLKFETYEKYFYEGGLELDIDNLTIDGNDKTIDGQDKSRIFIITGNNITLKNITFKNGHSYKNRANPINNSGAALKINHNVHTTITNCRFMNNVSEENGGVINNNGWIYIEKSTFNENFAEMGAVINNNNEATIINSKLTNNSVKKNYDDGKGGAIQNNGKLTITKSEINENTSQNGGAIYNCSGELIISDSTFTQNITKDWSGGAIYNDNGKLNILNSLFTENKAYRGGAIYNDGEMTIKTSRISQNKAYYAGAIFNNGELFIADSLFAQNSTNSDDSAIFNSFKLNITDSEFYQNSDGAISNNGELFIVNSVFTQNSANNTNGGAILNSSKLNILKSQFDGNISMKNGGAIANYDELFIIESKFNENMAKKGGAIFNSIIYDSSFTANNDNYLSITTSIFSQNTADCGQSIYNENSAKLQDVQFEMDSINNAIYNEGSLILEGKFTSPQQKTINNRGNVTTSEVNIDKIDNFHKIFELKLLNENQRDFTYLNELIQQGSNEIKLENDIILNISKNEDLTFKFGIKLNKNGLIIDGNGHTIDAQGATRIFECLANNIKIKNIILKNGYANEGGAIFNHNANLTIFESVLLYNGAKIDGGAIFNYGGHLNMTRSTLSSNYAERGGALYNNSILEIFNSTLSSNYAQIGGALHNSSSNLKIFKSTFSKNVATADGAIHFPKLRYTKLDDCLNDCIFNDNKPNDFTE